MATQNDPKGLAHAKNLIKENLESQATFLDIGNCGLRDLRELPELLECTHLEGLNLGSVIWEGEMYLESNNCFSKNEIGDLNARAIGENLGQLTSLHLWENQIGDKGAKSIAENLGQLTSLYLGLNQIDVEGAKTIAENLRQLTTLDLGSNQIGDEGTKLIAKHLNQLTSLYLDSNIIGYNGAKSIAEYLKKLTSLNLNYNQVDVVGAISIGNKLKQLTSLALGGNRIGNEGAKTIAEQLKKLTSLHLWDNQIGVEGAKSIAENLGQLTSLNLKANLIGDEGAKAIAKNLKSLTSLDLWRNQIGDEGAKLIAENLKLLTSLDLGYNQIGDEGAKVICKQFKNIKVLFLNNNNITNFTPFLFLLNDNPNLKLITDDRFGKDGLNLSKNPFTEPPMEVVKQGREAILRHYENLEKEKAVNLAPYINKEVKLIIVGNSNAGKSTLVKYLIENIIDRNLSSTHWMEVKDWKNPFPDNKDIDNIRIFDFGGQEYYHDTHHLFFTNNTAYLLLWDTDGNVFKEMEVDQNNKKVLLQCYPLDYWMDAISHFTRSKKDDNIPPEGMLVSKHYRILPEESPEAIEMRIQNFEDKYYKEAKPPLLIIQNKVDERRSIKLPLDRFVKQYNGLDIVDATFISLYKKRNLESLKYSLSQIVIEMNIVGDKFPGTYGIIRTELLNYSGSISLSFDDFKEICNKWILKAGKINKKNYKPLLFEYSDVFDCTNVFKWLGYILFFPDSILLKNRVFLDQKRITDAIYSVLLNVEASSGEISKALAKTKVKFAEQELSDIFALMQEFKIIFKHPDTRKKDTYIAPLYLPNHPTKGISFFLSSMQKPVYRIQYDGFIHKSIILEFFQEYGQYVLKESNVSHEDVFYYWRKAIVVKKMSENGKEGLVLVQFFDGEDTKDVNAETIRVPAHIDIFSLKDGSDELIKEIRIKLTEINKGWRVTEKVTADGVKFVPLEEIHKNESNKQYVFKYGEDYFQLIHFKQYLTKEYPMKKVFISYSKSDEHYRNELEKHLSVLKRNGHIATWHDRKLLPGEKWDGKIKQELKEADIILFLVSADFLATDYIWDVEIKEAIDRDKDPDDDVSVVPIILRKCDWMDSPLGQFNSPEKGKDISTASDKDKAIYKIVKELKELIKGKI